MPNKMPNALTWLNLYGCEAVRHKHKNSLKTSKMHFLQVFELMSGSLRLSHINPLRINQFYTSKDQSQKFSQKILRIGEALKKDCI